MTGHLAVDFHQHNVADREAAAFEIRRVAEIELFIQGFQYPVSVIEPWWHPGINGAVVLELWLSALPPKFIIG